MSIEIFTLPDVGEGLTEAEILSWRVAPGDEVTVNQIIVEIETAKAAVELPSPYAGRVHQLLVEPGITVEVGTPIISVDVGGTDPVAAPAATPTEEVGAKIGEVGADGRIATLVGFVDPNAGVTRRPRRTRVEDLDLDADEVPRAPARVVAAPAPVAAVVAEPVVEVAAAPLAAPPVRKLAKELGVELATVSPGRADGVITRAEVEAAAAPVASVSDPGSRERRIPIKGVRKMTAQAMVSSAFTAPHVTVFLTVDITPTLELRDRLRRRPEFRDVKIGPLTFAARAVCLALRRTPELNSTWEADAGEIVVKDYVHLGIAAATPRGLVVPNIRDADQLDLAGLAGELTALTETARAGRTPPAAMSGGTFTITNIGVLGVDTGTPILNPGESGILALGSVKDAPWVVDGKLEVRKVCPLALSFDHRVVDGQQGSMFLADVGALLSDPGLALAW